MKKFSIFNFQFLNYSGFSSGQTLIETIVALGLLTTGIVSGVGLVAYAIGSSDTALKQVIGTNLAREGIEIVRNMRDSNWLADTLDTTSPECIAIAGGSGQPCYPDWLDQIVNVDPVNYESYEIMGSTGQGVAYFPRFSPGNLAAPWTIYRQSQSPCTQQARNTRIYYSNSDHLYTTPKNSVPGGCNAPENTYYRQILIQRIPGGYSFNADNPRILVRSTVWWKGRGCPESDTPPGIPHCQIVMEDYLTNWKNY